MDLLFSVMAKIGSFFLWKGLRIENTWFLCNKQSFYNRANNAVKCNCFCTFVEIQTDAFFKLLGDIPMLAQVYNDFL